MRHQIKILFTAIIIVAGLATFALKADEIEGTWTQDGQYKKFSKEYKYLQFFDVSADGTRAAVISDSTLRIFEIESGKILTLISIPNVNNYGHQPYCISKDFNFFAITLINPSEQLYPNDKSTLFKTQVYDLKEENIILDSTCEADISILDYNNADYDKQIFFFTNDNIIYSKFFIKIDNQNSMYKRFAYDCIKKHVLDSSEIKQNYSIFFSSKNDKKFVGFYFQMTYYDVHASDRDETDYEEYIFVQKDTSVKILAHDSWAEIWGEIVEPHTGFCPYPIGITADDKMLMTQSKNKYIFYDLDSLGRSHQIINKYFDNTNPIILFPNDKKGDNYLTLKNINEHLFIRRMNYNQENEISSFAVNGYKIGNKDFTKMIDSSKILTYFPPNLYLLDLKTIPTVPELDVVSSKTSATTNDTLQFEIINPLGYSNLSIDFGDGNLANEHSVKHIYSKPGTYTISVSGKDKTGQITTYEKKDYINITQGLVLDFNIEVSYDQDSINIQVINTTQGEHLHQNISIVPGFDIRKSAWDFNCDSLSANFSGLGLYHISLQKSTDNSFNVLFRKDTIIEITGPKLGIISSEKCLNTNFQSFGYKGFKNIGSVDLFGYFDDYYYENTYTFPIVLTLNDQDEIINTFKGSERGNYGSLSKFGISKYSFLMVTQPSVFRGVFDLSNNRIDALPYYLESPFRYFMYNDTTYGIINNNSDIILYSINTNQKLSIIAEHSPISPQSTQIIKNNNGIIDFIYPENDIKVVKSSIDTNTNTIQTKEIETQLLNPSISYLQYCFENIMEIADEQYLTYCNNSIFKINFHTLKIDTISFPTDPISKIIKVNDNCFAIITYSKNKEYIINITDSTFEFKNCVALPLRTGEIIHSEITVDNQLKLIFSSSTCNLYICKIRIGDLASVKDANIITKEMPLIFPNPATNTITIEYPLTSQSSVSIVNESGHEYTANISSASNANFTIDTSLLPEGIYFVQIQDGEINKSVKFMVKR